LPRAEIIKNAFVLLPLAEIAADQAHPLCKKNYATLWAEYDKASQSLWSIHFEWRDNIISTAKI
jgi:2-amino-4-hydroxy-6-hydroxymethyldihydropteridine diphosphokinase